MLSLTMGSFLYDSLRIYHASSISQVQTTIRNIDSSCHCLPCLKRFAGRIHQLMVHVADKMNLGVPIFGDRLYGSKITFHLYYHNI
jgi:23S rRNA-/tRNA-specific pseudouridylate synthase